MNKPSVIITSLVLVIVIGTVFFHLVEGWSWVDSYFFSVITLSTVGYGSLVPATAAGKIFTTIFIFIGLGIFAIAIQQFGVYMVRKRQEQDDWMVAHLGRHPHHNTPEEPPRAANEDEDPEP
ncbi:potassium channel family protein [Rhodobacteraceae bacterium LMO-12]|nr:potassium channel family protein [Rhodobacteraceae bacterium LMO-JJ12]